jgi:hypothetical protein
VSGNADLAGNMNLFKLPSYVPAANDSFQSLTYASHSGTLNVAPQFVSTFTPTFSATGLTTVLNSLTVNNFWNVDTDGDWNDPTKWSLTHVPTANETAVIDRANANPVVFYTATGAEPTVGELQNAETFTISGGSLTLAGLSSSSGILNISGGTLIANGGLSASTLNLSSGALIGSGSVTVTNAYTHTGGAINIGGAASFSPRSAT